MWIKRDKGGDGKKLNRGKWKKGKMNSGEQEIKKKKEGTKFQKISKKKNMIKTRKNEKKSDSNNRGNRTESSLNQKPSKEKAKKKMR